LLGFYIAAGILNVVLTNIVNFYDGADLNLATFIALTSVVILIFTPSDDVMAISAVACLAFVFPFAVMNSRPKTIYLGDAGSFAFAGFLTMIAISYFSRGQPSAEAAIPLALPALDTFYVLCIRIVERHDLMTRNYLHLYQKLNQRYRGFGYLLPQIINAGLTLACAVALQARGLNSFVSVAVASVLVTIPFYFSCRRLFVREPASCGEAT
jgi:UDP-N-acetylmuramyl pentapeptide phosphotransferase/UDP-N-acetylglucosamine-1-phosphate transferase